MQTNSIPHHPPHRPDPEPARDKPPAEAAPVAAQKAGAQTQSQGAQTRHTSSAAPSPATTPVRVKRDGNASSSGQSAPAPDPGTSQTATIFAANVASPPDPDMPLQQRKDYVDAYADRVKDRIDNVETGSEAQRNVNFLSARPFTKPAGYFSGGLLAAGIDPNSEVTRQREPLEAGLAQHPALARERPVHAVFEPGSAAS
ncbi:MAG TPA: hypothetical protein VL689_11550 [Paraburkholderia sp.]|jgi:hypothetical protein|nr:hypothetical protein [Paraburkholderia sp.]